MDGYGLGFITGRLSGTVVDLRPQTVVGCDGSADVRLVDEGVAPHHARLIGDGSTFHLLALNEPQGTFVDGYHVSPAQPVSLRPGSLVRFGETGPLAVFELSARLHQPGELVVAREDLPGRWPLNGAAQVGRAPDCEIQLDPRDVAGSHEVHLLAAFGMCVITDVGSAQGCWVNGTRVYQVAVPVGGSFSLAPSSGPRFRIERAGVASVHAAPAQPVKPAVQQAPPPPGVEAIPETFTLAAWFGDEQARIQVACRPEVHFGSFAGLNDFEMVCFPRELESEDDAMERSESIGPQHGSFVLNAQAIDLVDGGYAPTKLNGTLVPAQHRVPLSDIFTLFVGDDSLGLRGRVFRHPGLQPTAPSIGLEARHPVECLVAERMGDGDSEASRLYLMLVRQASVGSADEAAIRLPYPGVGAQHGLIYLRASQLWVTQLGPDPVVADGVSLSPGTTMPLQIGSTFEIGPITFRVEE